MLDVRRPLLVVVSGLVLALPACSSDGDDGGTAASTSAAASASATQAEPSAEASTEVTASDAPSEPEIDASCTADEVAQVACRFVSALQDDDLSPLSDAERGVAEEAGDVPAGAFTLTTCDLVGDVTVSCGVEFSDDGTTATVDLAPTETAVLEGAVQPAEGSQYEVVQFVGPGGSAS